MTGRFSVAIRRTPNTSAYCQYAHCAQYNNVGFTYLLTFGNNDSEPIPAPEPGTALLVGAGLMHLAVAKRRANRSE
jgi:hypothetical protein